MTDDTSTIWTFGPDDGDLTLRTGVTGRAARTGHRLTIVMKAWQARVEFTPDESEQTPGVPSSVRVDVEVGSLEVRSGEGGLTPLSPPEKVVARANALKSLKADRFPAITYRSDDVEPTETGYRLTGTLTILGNSRPRTVELTVTGSEAGRRIDGESIVTQTDFGLKPFSLMMGAIKVADDVRVAVDVRRSA